MQFNILMLKDNKGKIYTKQMDDPKTYRSKFRNTRGNVHNVEQITRQIKTKITKKVQKTEKLEKCFEVLRNLRRVEKI